MIYFSALFKERFPDIHQQISSHMVIKYIPNTQDIWIRDFMPITNTELEYILFRYYPKYLNYPKYHSLITGNTQICNELDIAYTYSDLILDGGSVVYNNGLYFVSERILVDNPSFSKNQIIQILEGLFKTDIVILLPEAPNDFTGHLDGVISILDHNTILMNDYNDEYGYRVRNILKSQQFDIETLPYNPYSNKTYQSAKGIYINFIKTDHLLLTPIFKQREDDLAINKLQDLFPKHVLAPIYCNDLAKEGGLLHCISWEG
ncbi:MAG: hypothetical protein EOO99_06370 [Pedobacter sp.]|nr:MAG: hypothetical protein EOO99_06370 [Pedobacter sp.]